MSRSPKEQRERIILAVLMSLAVSVGIWCGLIEPERAGLQHRAKLIADTQAKLSTVRRELRLTDSFKAHLDSTQKQIESMESKMPSGDVYRWAIRSITSLQSNNVEIANLEPPRIGESSILPKVPYKTALFSLNGTAHYHDFGRFLANLENNFPHMRLQRLELEPMQFGEATTASQEQLSFKIEVLALIKATAGEP